MDIDSEYARFMSELDAPAPSTLAPPASKPPASPQPAKQGESPASVRPPYHSHPYASDVHSATLPPPPGRVPPAGAPPPIHPPPDVIPGMLPSRVQRPTMPPPPITASPTGPRPHISRPDGIPPPIASATLSGAATIAPPPGRPPAASAAEAPHLQSHTLSAGAQVAPPQTSACVPAAAAAGFQFATLDPAKLRDEILAEKKKDGGRKKRPKEGAMRVAGGETWIDDKMDFWPENDFRIFVGNLGPEVNEDVLAKAFNTFPSYAKCRIIQDYKKCKTKAYGFVSFTDAADGSKALKQMHGKYIGNRPCQLHKSSHTVRNPPKGGGKRKAMMSNEKERLTTKRMR